MKELTNLNKSYVALCSQGVDKHFKKMIRKCLMLTVEQPNALKANNILAARLPSNLHVASIMNEKTNDEKQMFGKVNLSEMKTTNQRGI